MPQQTTDLARQFISTKTAERQLGVPLDALRCHVEAGVVAGFARPTSTGRVRWYVYVDELERLKKRMANDSRQS